MGVAPETRLIVKHTFLEMVIDAPTAEKRNRSLTDGAITCLERCPGEVLNVSSVDAGVTADVCKRLMAEPAQVAQGDVHSASYGSRQAVADEEIADGAAPSDFCGASGAWPMATGGCAMMMLMSPMGPSWFMPMIAMPNQANSTEAVASQAKGQMLPCSASTFDRATHSSAAAGAATDERTTLMLRNLPNQYTRDMLIQMLNKEGFAGKYHFVYLPIDFKTHAGLGYAFVDLISGADAERMRTHFEGFSRWIVKSEKICSVSWSHPEQQGVDAHVQRYRNSPIMHEEVPDSWKPALFSAGVRVEFPPPTRKLRNLPRGRAP